MSNISAFKHNPFAASLVAKVATKHCTPASRAGISQRSANNTDSVHFSGHQMQQAGAQQQQSRAQQRHRGREIAGGAALYLSGLGTAAAGAGGVVTGITTAVMASNPVGWGILALGGLGMLLGAGLMEGGVAVATGQGDSGSTEGTVTGV